MAWLATAAGVVTDQGRVICEAPIHYLDSAKDWQKNAAVIVAAPAMFEFIKKQARDGSVGAAAILDFHFPAIAKEQEA